MQLFLIGMQVMSVGLNFVFWAMLPNTIEYGEQATGLHVEGAVFGVAALLQRIAIGIATAILGWSFASAGYVANVQQSAATLDRHARDGRARAAAVPRAVLRRDAAQPARAASGRRSRRSARSVPWTPSLSADGAIQTSKVPGSTVRRAVAAVEGRGRSRGA